LPGLAFDRERHFPRLASSSYELTSPETPDYNCFAWALRSEGQWLAPVITASASVEPEEFATEVMSWLMGVLSEAGFERTSWPGEPGFEHLAVYADAGEPLHLARQLPNGHWTSKLGRWEDIEHSLPDALEGPLYGTVVGYFRRPDKAFLQ
jgi:hypothetical protein